MQFRGGSIPISNITYAVKEGVRRNAGVHPPRGVNGIYAFALPDNQ